MDTAMEEPQGSHEQFYDETVDEERDELANSDIEDEEPSGVGTVANPTEALAIPSGDSKEPKRPKTKPPTERPPGQSLLPMTRVQKIMRADKELAGTAKEALFLVSVATEEFIKRLAQAGQTVASRDNRTVVTEKDLAAAVRKHDELLFLHEVIPLPMLAREALAHRKTKVEGGSDPKPKEKRPPGELEIAFERGKVKKARGKATVGTPSGPGTPSELPQLPAQPGGLMRSQHPSYFGGFTGALQGSSAPNSRAMLPPNSRHNGDSMDTS